MIRGAFTSRFSSFLAGSRAPWAAAAAAACVNAQSASSPLLHAASSLLRIATPAAATVSTAIPGARRDFAAALVFDVHGEPADVLRLEDEEAGGGAGAPPGPGQVVLELIAVRA